ncbi:MAG: hypothetical protein ACLTYW_06835 [Collinsella sp.]
MNIPHVCEAMKADEIEVLAKDAMADACFPGNPREATLDDVIELFRRSARLLKWFGPLPVSPQSSSDMSEAPLRTTCGGASSVLRKDSGANGQGPAARVVAGAVLEGLDGSSRWVNICAWWYCCCGFNSIWRVTGVPDGFYAFLYY